MAGFAEGLARGFNPAFTRSWAAAQDQGNLDREYGMRKQEHDLRVAEAQRVAAQRDLEDQAYSRLEAVEAGFGLPQQAQVQQTYGMNPQQIAAATRAPGGLPGVLQGYDAPDSYDLQQVPQGRMAGTPFSTTAANVQPQAPNRMDMLAARRGVARATRDMGALDQLDQRQKAYAAEDAVIQATKGFQQNPAAVWGQLAATYNPQDSGVPVLVEDVGPDGFAKVSFALPNKKSKTIKLSAAQQLKVVQAVSLMDHDPLRAQEMLASVDKDFGAMVGQMNELTMGVAKGNNAMVGDRAQIRQGDERLRIARSELGVRKAAVDAQNKRADASQWRPIGLTEDRKGLVRYNAVTGQSEVSPLPPNVTGDMLFPKTTGLRAPREITVQDRLKIAEYASTLVGEPDPANPRRKMDQRRAMEVAQQQALGLEDTSGVEIDLTDW